MPESLRHERILASPRYRDGAFHNTHQVGLGIKGNPLPVLGEFFFGGGKRKPHIQVPVADPREAWTRPSETGLRSTWLGHSTVLLEIDGARVLTDPVFGQRASPFTFAGPKRFHATPVRIDQLPPLNAVLLSHDHYDHLCEESARQLAALRVPFVTSLGVGAQLEAFGVDPALIHEPEWWDSARIGGVTFTATPAQHFSGRMLGGRNRTAWSSWVLEGERHRVFFSGDTGLTDEFLEIGQKKGPFDLTMLEVGAFHPSWGDIHLGPENALRAFEMLGGGTLLPVHWGTFDLALHGWDDPIAELDRFAAAKGARIITPRLGTAVEPARVDSVERWWMQPES